LVQAVSAPVAGCPSLIVVLIRGLSSPMEVLELKRALSAEYAAGASKYTEDDMRRWLTLGKKGKACLDRASQLPDAEKPAELRKAVAAFRAVVALRPDHAQSQKFLDCALELLGPALDEAETTATVCSCCMGAGVLLGDPCPLCEGECVFFDSVENAAFCNALVNQSQTVRTSNGRMPFVFDMETDDPDDLLTLLFLAVNPDVELKAVTIARPGSRDQVALVRWLLEEVGLPNVRVGAQDWPQNIDGGGDGHAKLEARFYKSFGRLKIDVHDCEPASQVLRACCDENTTLVTGAPLTNLAKAIAEGGFRLGKWVAQGGFAGEGVVPRHLQMEEFKGKRCKSSFNFKDLAATRCALQCEDIGRKVFVGGNVCNRAYYDNSEVTRDQDGRLKGGWHAEVGEALKATKASGGQSVRLRALELMHAAMTSYGRGKTIYDPLALAVAFDESVATLAEVELEEKPPGDGDPYTRWGCWLCPGSGKWIAIDYDETKFRRALLGRSF